MPWFKHILFSLTFLVPQSLFSQNDNKFLKIYSTILNKSCSLGGCHDGSFEPNFTNIMSSYNTLVYHPIVKNNREETFEYRVVPYDYQNSVLYERITNCCFVDEDDQMPFYDKEGLSADKIALIKNWIQEGALDIYGNKPSQVITYPTPGNIKIVSKEDEGMNKHQIQDFILNIYNEPIALKLKKEHSYLAKIPLNIQSNDIFNLAGKYRLSIVSSDGKEVKSYPVEFNVEKNLLLVEINTCEFENDTFYQLVLKNESLPNFIYPSNTTQPYLKAHWSFYLQSFQ